MIVTTGSKTYLPEEDVAGRFAELVVALEASPRLTVEGSRSSSLLGWLRPFYRSWTLCGGGSQ